MPDKTIPSWFWIVAVLALIWNFMGAYALYIDFSLTPEKLATLDEQLQQAYAARPQWSFMAFCVAVIAGVLGSILLLLRRGWAAPVYLFSLIGVLVQHVYSFGIAKLHQMRPAEALIEPFIVLFVAIMLVWFARRCASRGWIT